MSDTVSAERIAAIAGRLTARPQAQPYPELPPQATSPFHLAASVLVWHDQTTVRPLGDGSDEDRERLRADSTLVADEQGQTHYSLTSDVRTAALRELREKGLIPEALAVNPDRTKEHAQSIYEAWLSGTGLPLDEARLTDLTATHLVCGWLRAAGFTSVPDSADLQHRIDWLTLLEPFEQIAGEHFRGRVEELKTLRAYAGVLPPGSRTEAARRFVEHILSLQEKPPLLIHGPGGVGKSTLLARFILEHARAHEADRFPFAYLNYDRPQIAPSDPLSLLIEAVRQLGVEYPEGRVSCEHLRLRWLDTIAAAIRDSNQPYEANPALVRLHPIFIRDFASLVETLGAQDRPLLMVLDTFEEVQVHSEEFVDAVWRFLDQLQKALPRLRVVIAGRAAIETHRTQSLPLMGLDEEAAVGYLMHRGVRDPAVAKRLARQLGGSPLSLKLAIEVIEKEGLSGGGQLDVKTRESLFTRMDDALIQRQLYKRVLGHVRDPMVRRLAHPGLALRRITPELILEVLNGPCGLEIKTMADAEILFHKLRQEVALVSVASDGSLQHRADLRKLMVDLLHQSEPEKALAIHRAAVKYYAGGDRGAAERAEEIYHRLRLDQATSTIDKRWRDGVEQFLFSAIDEFTGSRKAYLAAKLRVEVDPATRRLASLEDWERIVARKATELLGFQEGEKALTELRQRSERSVASPLYLIEAQVLTVLGRRKEAHDILERGIEVSVREGHRTHALALALAQTDGDWPTASVEQLAGL